MIKIFAMFFMFIDHFGRIFFPNEIIYTIIGRSAFPLFAFAIARGYEKTKNYKLYVTRVLILALISQPIYYYLFNQQYLNVCFTLASGLLLLKLIDSKLKFIIKIILMVILIHIVLGLNFEYGLYGLILIVIFRYFNSICVLLLSMITLNIVTIMTFNVNIIQIWSIMSILIIHTFKNNKFRINKLVSYLFYPIHLVFLYILDRILLAI